MLRSAPLLAAVLVSCAFMACTAIPPAPSPTPGASATPSAPLSPSASPVPTASPTATQSPVKSPTPTQSPTPSGPVTVGLLPEALNGTFAARIKSGDVAHLDEAGDWYLTLTPDRGYQIGLATDGQVENYGTLTVDGDQLTLSNERGPGACPPSGGVYRWSVSVYSWGVTGDRLTLTTISDECAVRVNQNSKEPYWRCPDGVGSCETVLNAKASGAP